MISPLLAALSASAAATELPGALFTQEGDAAPALKIPSSYESAVMGRRILALSKLAELSTVFPSSSHHHDGVQGMEHRPSELGHVPIGLMDYVADCEDDGNPTILAIKIATSFKNVEAGSNISVSMRWQPPYPPAKRIGLFSRLTKYIPFLSHGDYNVSPDSTPDPVPYSAANLPRFSLLGYLEPIHPGPVETVKLESCFTSKHQDAKWWLPGNVIHESEWARMVVTHVYWIGGFGDRAYIGWIPLAEWQNVTREEWQSIKLPGEEKGWSEWSVDSFNEL